MRGDHRDIRIVCNRREVRSPVIAICRARHLLATFGTPVFNDAAHCCRRRFHVRPVPRDEAAKAPTKDFGPHQRFLADSDRRTQVIEHYRLGRRVDQQITIGERFNQALNAPARLLASKTVPPHCALGHRVHQLNAGRETVSLVRTHVSPVKIVPNEVTR